MRLMARRSALLLLALAVIAGCGVDTPEQAAMSDISVGPVNFFKPSGLDQIDGLSPDEQLIWFQPTQRHDMFFVALVRKRHDIFSYRWSRIVLNGVLLGADCGENGEWNYSWNASNSLVEDRSTVAGFVLDPQHIDHVNVTLFDGSSVVATHTSPVSADGYWVAVFPMHFKGEIRVRYFANGHEVHKVCNP